MIVHINTKANYVFVHRGQETKRDFDKLVNSFDDIIADELRLQNLPIENALIADLKINGKKIPIE